MYFTMEEFRCKCGCNKLIVSGILIDKLNEARKIFGKPMILNSGYRCKQHNADIGGSPNSAHLAGAAADIKCDNSRDRFNMLKALIEVGFNRIGIAETFIHVDISKNLDQEVTWLY